MVLLAELYVLCDVKQTRGSDAPRCVQSDLMHFVGGGEYYRNIGNVPFAGLLRIPKAWIARAAVP